MELNISDLLDELPEVSVHILPYTTVSEIRVKELTLEKVRGQGKPKVRKLRGGLVRKVLVAAVLISALTFTVMAASGIRFEDWLAGLEKPKEGAYSGYDTELLTGGTAYYWEVSNWMLHIDTVDAAATGMTVDCWEYGNAERIGTLTMDGSFWLEQWNGSGYEPIEASIPAAEQVKIEKQSKYRWYVDWGTSHGQLLPGSYRLGIPFTYTAQDGTEQAQKFYAKFRIFSEDMDSYIQKCNDAVKLRYEQPVLHFKETRYPHNMELQRELGYVCYTKETWKNGEDFLQATRYYDENGQYIETYGGGHLCRDGIGYTMEWEDEALTKITEWERASFVEGDDVAYSFYLHAEVMTPTLGEVWDDGSTVYLINYYDNIDESLLTPEEIEELEERDPIWNYNYDENIYRFDEAGNLTGYEHIVKTAKDGEHTQQETTYILEIYDTAPEEIERIIRSQDVSNPVAFSWADEQNRYGETAKKSGFRNTAVQKVISIDTAVDIARAEAVITEHPAYREGDVYNLAKAYYDEGADVWKVVFGYSQDDDKQICVYMSGSGITLMTAYP